MAKLDQKMQELLDESTAEGLFQALLDAAVDGVVVIDRHGCIMVFNSSAQKLFGYNADEVLGKNVSMLMPEPYHSAHDDYIARYHQTGERKIIGIGREVTAVTKAGREFPIDLSVGQAMLHGEAVYVGLIRDLRQRNHLQAELRMERQNVRNLERTLAHVHRTSTLGEMAAGIAHEINQPLAAIANYADGVQRLIARPDLETDKVDYALAQIASQARRAGAVVQRIRALAGSQESQLAQVDINQVIEEVIDLAHLESRESGAEIALDLDDNLPEIMVDAIQIQQVLLNLLRNGLEAILTRSQADKGLRVESKLDDEHVVVSVVDHGSGVSTANVATIFDPFVTSKPGGLGVGLSICASIIRNHGGKLWHEDNPDGGSIFKFSIPTGRD